MVAKEEMKERNRIAVNDPTFKKKDIKIMIDNMRKQMQILLLIK